MVSVLSLAAGMPLVKDACDLGRQPARRYRSSSPDQIRPLNGWAPTGHAFFAYADDYPIDLKAAIIVDVEAIRQAEVGRNAP